MTNEKKQLNWKYFRDMARECYGQDDNECIAWCLGAVHLLKDQGEVDDDPSEMYKMLYESYLKSDYKTAQHYFEALILTNPSDRSLIVDWYTKFENIAIGQVDETSKKIEKVWSSESKETIDAEAAHLDWILVKKDENLSEEQILFGVKVGNDNTKHFVQLDSAGSYIVTPEFCKKKGIEFNNYMLDVEAQKVNQFISVA